MRVFARVAFVSFFINMEAYLFVFETCFSTDRWCRKGRIFLLFLSRKRRLRGCWGGKNDSKISIFELA